MPLEQTPYVYAATAFVTVLAMFGLFALVSNKIIEPLAKFIHGVFEERSRQGKSVSAKHLEFGGRHRRYAWGTVLLLVIAAHGAATKKERPQQSADADTMVRGFYGLQVIKCAGMNDLELAANDSHCRFAIKQSRGY